MSYRYEEQTRRKYQLVLLHQLRLQSSHAAPIMLHIFSVVTALIDRNTQYPAGSELSTIVRLYCGPFSHEIVLNFQ